MCKVIVPMSVYIRPQERDDDPWVVDLYNREEGESLPFSIQTYREVIEMELGRVPGERWIAELDGTRVGYAKAEHAWWTGRTDVFLIEICVEAEHRSRGIGVALLEAMQAQMDRRGAARLLGWVRAESEASERFALHAGFQRTGKVMDDYRLDVDTAHSEAYGAVVERLAHEGIRVSFLAVLQSEDEEWLHAVQRLEWAIVYDAIDERALEREFDAWRESALHGAGRSAETYWVALEGNRPVGLTFLRRLTPDGAENDFTAVLPAARGRGIAALLKVRTIEWARENDVHAFYTSHEVDNARMIAVNRKLGYTRGVQRLEVARDLHPPLLDKDR
jgi:GNAT superfamily N-acetyltransferase